MKEQIVIDRETGEVRDPPGRLTDDQVEFWSDLLVQFILTRDDAIIKTA